MPGAPPRGARAVRGALRVGRRRGGAYDARLPPLRLGRGAARVHRRRALPLRAAVAAAAAAAAAAAEASVGKGKGGGGDHSPSEGGGEAAAAPSGKKTPDPPPVVDVVGVVRDAKGGKATAMLAPVAPTHSWPIEFYVASLGLASGGKRTTSVVNLPTADSGDGTGGAWPHVSFPNLACDGAYDVWVMTCNKVGCSDKAHVALQCDDFAAPPPPPCRPPPCAPPPAAAAEGPPHPPPPPPTSPPRRRRPPRCRRAPRSSRSTELRSQTSSAPRSRPTPPRASRVGVRQATASGQRCLYDASRKPSACYKRRRRSARADCPPPPPPPRRRRAGRRHARHRRASRRAARRAAVLRGRYPT